MDYGAIIKRSWEITKKYRFIWWLGLLAILAEGGMSGFNGADPNLFDNLVSPTPTAISIYQPKGETKTKVLSDTTEQIASKAKNYDSYSALGIAIFTILAIALFIILLYISYSASAGLILSAERLETSNVSLGFQKAFHQGRNYAWRLFALRLLPALLILIIGGIIMTPLLILVATNSLSAGYIISSILLIIAGIILIIPLAIYLSIVILLGSRHLVIKNGRIVKSLKEGHLVFMRNFGKSLIVWLIFIGLGLGYAFIILIAGAIAGGTLFLFGLLIFLLFKAMGAIIYGVLAFLILLAAVLIIGGIFTGFISVYWTLSYRALSFLKENK